MRERRMDEMTDLDEVTIFVHKGRHIVMMQRWTVTLGVRRREVIMQLSCHYA